MCLFLLPPKPPRLRAAKKETKARIRWKGPAQQRHLLLGLSEDLGVDRKRKCVEEFASSSASAHKTVAGETLDPEDDEELFDALDL
jgi:hypothetical protein